jgi:actin-like ATPase involved in cell morphogenesis
LRAAIAVPANAHGAQRLITLDAFRQAGMEVAAMLNEPSAAGFEYTHRHRDTFSVKRDVVVVYDLGGGTFDSSVVRMIGRHHEVLATAGVAHLGGDDFDTVLANIVLDRLGLSRETFPERSMLDLLDQCRTAKETLSPSSRKITIDLERSIGLAGRPDITLPASDFYDACAPLVERTIESMLPIMSRMEDEAALAEVAGIYVVGGGSELPIVARTLKQRFGRRVHRSPYPSAAVAIGLSIAAHAAAGFEIVDRYSRVFGVFRENAEGREITYDRFSCRRPSSPPAVRLACARADIVRRTTSVIFASSNALGSSPTDVHGGIWLSTPTCISPSTGAPAPRPTSRPCESSARPARAPRSSNATRWTARASWTWPYETSTLVTRRPTASAEPTRRRERARSRSTRQAAHGKVRGWASPLTHPPMASSRSGSWPSI